MGLETVTHISDLVVTNPTSTDPKNQGDDHLRNLKTALRNDFAGFTGAVCVTGTDGGSANAYTLTPATTLPAYSNRMLVVFSPTANNTGASTLNISGLGAQNLRRVDGTDVVSGDLVSGYVYAAEYNGTEFRLLSITKNYADQLAFSAALPAQTGNVDYLLTTNGSVAAWTYKLKAGTIRFVDSSDTTKQLAFDVSGITTGTTRTLTSPNKNGTIATLADVALTLVATITPTAAANIDALNVFSSSYDAYVIVGEGITVAANDSLNLRLATSGAADSGSNYSATVADNTQTTSTASFISVSPTGASILNGGKGCDFIIEITNANDATNLKSVHVRSAAQSSVTPGWISWHRGFAYFAANAVSGFRLYLNGGNNFGATGKIYIYGYRNS
jgi:hypothetical protein